MTLLCGQSSNLHGKSTWFHRRTYDSLFKMLALEEPAEKWSSYPLECRGNYSATSHNMKLVHWPLLHLVQRGGDWAGLQPARPLLAVPNVTTYPSTASVPTTVLMYNGPLLYRFNVLFKWLALGGPPTPPSPATGPQSPIRRSVFGLKRSPLLHGGAQWRAWWNIDR